MGLSVIDYIFFLIILIFALGALIKGFVNEIFGKAAWILGILGGVLFYEKIAGILPEKIPGFALKNILAFIILFVVIFLVIKIIGAIISKIFEISILKSLDRTLGFMFGLVEGCAIVVFLIFIITIQPFFNPSALLNDSFIFSVYSKVIASPEFKEVTNNV